jgi:uncharacterized membrane protein YeaQ/YmgE (transglycosylase-associated protein family)
MSLRVRTTTTSAAVSRSGRFRCAVFGSFTERSLPMINFILWLLFGALVGWLASMVMKTDAQQGTLMNIIVGIVGAFIGGLVFNLAGFSGTNINDSAFSLSSLVVSFIGAVILLGIVNMVRRGQVR